MPMAEEGIKWISLAGGEGIDAGAEEVVEGTETPPPVGEPVGRPVGEPVGEPVDEPVDEGDR